MYLADYHTHSKYSPDSSSQMNAMIECAVANNLKEIAITDHFDPTISDKDFEYYKPNEYFRDLNIVKEKYQNQIKIKAGIEIGQAHLYYENCKRIVETYDYDYVIGSLHNIENDTDIAFMDYGRIDVDSMLRQYFKELKQVAQTDCYDCLGHLDYPKRYIFKNRMKFYTKQYLEMIEDILKAVIENDKGIEINTSGYNYYPAYTMPSMEILKLYKSLGGEKITTGSDAHIYKNIGKRISYAINTLYQVGFRYLTVYNNRVPSYIKIDNLY